jgi:hypothetical protein
MSFEMEFQIDCHAPKPTTGEEQIFTQVVKSEIEALLIWGWAARHFSRVDVSRLVGGRKEPLRPSLVAVVEGEEREPVFHYNPPNADTGSDATTNGG